MANFFGIFLVSSLLLTGIQCASNDQFVGRTCRSDSSTAFGLCIPTDDCEDGYFLPTAITPAINPSAPIRCPAFLTCCIPTQQAAEENKQGCGWLQEGSGDVLKGLAKRREVPWTVGIYVPVSKSGANHRMRFISNGVLVHQRAVVTVAHKTARYSALLSTGVYAVVGEYDQRVIKQAKKALKIQEIVLHPDYNKDTSEWNLALLILKSPVPAFPHVRPVCLPAAALAPGTACFFTGWGNDTDFRHQSILTKTEASIISQEECSLTLRPYLGSRYWVRPSLVCARGPPKSDLCKGDAGSPLVCPIEGETGRYQLAGLVTYVADCGPTGLPVVFADVLGASQWITDTIAARGLTVTT